MRIVPCICILVLCLTHLKAQTAASDRILAQVCDCMQTYDFEQMNYDSLLHVGDSCLQKGLLTDLTGLMREYGVDLDDSKSMQRLGELLGQRLYQNCDAYRAYSLQMSMERIAVEQEPYERSQGVLIDLDLKQVPPVFVLWTDNELALEFSWVREFDGSARFFEGIEPYQTERVEIAWRNVELYNAETQRYQTHREIKLIEKIGEISPEEQKIIAKKWKKYQRKAKKRAKARK